MSDILSARGLNLAKEALSIEKKLTEAVELPFDEVVRIELRVIVEQIRSLNKSIAELEKTIGEEGSKLEGLPFSLGRVVQSGPDRWPGCT